MDAIELLTTRSSNPRLAAPAPSAQDWQIIQRAAVRAPDHAALTPWQFIVFGDEASLLELGKLYANAALLANPEVEQAVLDKAKGLPLRAPMVVACIARCVEHPKVPRVEQVASAACAVMAMQQAAFALGYGGIWRTGDYAHNPHMKPLLGLQPQDEIVGYLYLGSLAGQQVIKPEKPFEPYFVDYSADK